MSGDGATVSSSTIIGHASEANENQDGQGELHDSEVAARIADLGDLTEDLNSMCELMYIGTDPVLTTEPTTENQAESLVEFYISMFGRMAELVDDEGHSQALSSVARWFNENLGDAESALASFQAGQELEALQTPEVEAALEYVSVQIRECQGAVSE